MTAAVPSEQHLPPVDGDLVTVVIPARNEQASIGACLAAAQAQTHRNLQILVVDGDSEDRTVEIVRAAAAADPRIELVHNPDRVIPVSLNLAVAAARAKWLVRIDAHATVPPDYVARAVALLRTGQYGAVGGRKDGVGRTPAGRAIAAAMGSRFGVGGSTYHHGTAPQEVEHVPFGAYPVEVVRELGGWDEQLRVNQDFEFDHRVRQAGHRILFDPSLVIAWESRQSVPELFRQYRRYGRGKVFVLRKHPGSASPRHLAAPAVVVLWLAAGVMAVSRPRRAAALLLPYAGALSVASVRVSRRLTSRDDRRWVPAAFLAMHGGWGIGFWQGIASLVVAPRRGGRQS